MDLILTELYKKFSESETNVKPNITQQEISNDNYFIIYQAIGKLNELPFTFVDFLINLTPEIIKLSGVVEYYNDEKLDLSSNSDTTEIEFCPRTRKIKESCLLKLVETKNSNMIMKLSKYNLIYTTDFLWNDFEILGKVLVKEMFDLFKYIINETLKNLPFSYEEYVKGYNYILLIKVIETGNLELVKFIMNFDGVSYEISSSDFEQFPKSSKEISDYILKKVSTNKKRKYSVFKPIFIDDKEFDDKEFDDLRNQKSFPEFLSIKESFESSKPSKNPKYYKSSKSEYELNEIYEEAIENKNFSDHLKLLDPEKMLHIYIEMIKEGLFDFI